MDWATAKFGSELELLDGSKKATSEVIAGKKVVGIYFSAHWVSSGVCVMCMHVYLYVTYTYILIFIFIYV